MEHSTEQVRGPAAPETPAQVAKRVGLWVVGVIALVAVVGAPAVASWHGLVAFGSNELGLDDGLQYVVPVSLDGAACYAAVLATRAILAGDSAIWPRFLTAVYAVAGAGFNAHAASSEVASLFFGGASLSAVVLWDTTLRMLKRDQLRELGAIEGMAARYRPLRWVLAPDETGRAWKTAVLENITDPRQALRIARGVEQLPADKPQEQRPGLPGPDDGPPNGDGPGSGPGGGMRVEFGTPIETPRVSPQPSYVPVSPRVPRALPEGTTKAVALRGVFDELGEKNVPKALQVLAERGVEMDRSYAYTVKWEPTPRLRAVNGGEQ